MPVYNTGDLTIYRINLLRCNCYTVQYKGHSLLVDTGPAWEWTLLRHALCRGELSPPEAVLLTHAHKNHAGAVKRVQAAFGFGCPAYAHPLAAEALQGVAGFEELPLAELCGPGSYILETPGHSGDSISVIIPDPAEGGAAIVGDAMRHTTPDYLLPSATDEQELAGSWRRLLTTGCSIFLPGHGAPVEAELLSARERELAEQALPELAF